MIHFRCKHCNEDLTADEVAAWHRGLDEAQKLSPLVHPDLTTCRNNLQDRLATVEDELNKRGRVWTSIHYADQSK